MRDFDVELVLSDWYWRNSNKAGLSETLCDIIREVDGRVVCKDESDMRIQDDRNNPYTYWPNITPWRLDPGLERREDELNKPRIEVEFAPMEPEQLGLSSDGSSRRRFVFAFVAVVPEDNRLRTAERAAEKIVEMFPVGTTFEARRATDGGQLQYRIKGDPTFRLIESKGGPVFDLTSFWVRARPQTGIGISLESRVIWESGFGIDKVPEWRLPVLIRVEMVG